MNVLRSIAAVVTGLIVSNAVFFLVGTIANRLYPTPPELMDPQTPEATALRVATTATNSLILVVLGSALGGFTGGVTSGAIVKERAIVVVGIVAGVLCLWGLYSWYVFYPARLWFPVGLLISFPLFTSLGAIAVDILRKRLTAQNKPPA